MKEIESFTGLSEEEAARRLKQDGYNELPYAKKRNILSIAFSIVREPMFLLLIAGGIIYLLLGDLEEALILLAFVFVVLGITFYQERKTERTLEALRDMSSPRALVIREGKQKRIAGREVVRGDIIILREGDRVPADAVVLSCTNLLVDESLLTGESVPVRKSESDGKAQTARPGGDDIPFVYSGTLVVQGYGTASVQSIGVSTEMGRIGKALQRLEIEESPLKKQTGKLVRDLAVISLILSAVVVVVFGLTRGNWLNAFLAGITLSMAMLPEEFPVVLTIFLALGAWRISQKNVLTRRSQAIQTLGSATVLCVDKTGTLTLNRMTVKKIFASGKFHDIDYTKKDILPESFHQLVEFGILASQKDPFDPMEKAIKELGHKELSNTEHIHKNWLLVKEYPLSKQLLALSHVWKSPEGNDYVIAAKGAPEAIADLCHMDKNQLLELENHIEIMAKDGMRVIGIAKAHFRQTGLPPGQHDFQFQFIGLMGFEDPVRPNVAESVAECYSAGIRIVMITGDYPSTAQSIAGEIGLRPSGQIIVGPELDRMDDSELKERIKTATIFARVVPEQKLRIVEALKSNGEIVVMTGDGVNDAPALKSAHIGIAMGGRGTDVAREASALVLLDDDFSSIVQAIKLGRRISDNLKKAMSYILAVHVPIAGMSLLPVIFNMPLVLLPVHIAFLELIIDPACSVAFENEPEEDNIMKRPPASIKEPLFGRDRILASVFQGAVVLAAVMTVFVVALYRGHGEAESRGLAFITLVITNIGLIFTNRSLNHSAWKMLKSKNTTLWWIVGATLLFLALIFLIPFLTGLFRFEAPVTLILPVSLIAAVSSIMFLEMFKFLVNRRKRTNRTI
ncbi:MAG: cation-translocating P-type ATPase [Candidatus Aenigmarchaeota archaeon]|nr:cation-translocating P-type ATPase [Candidatus Aenigmarchaeota archaeon]